MPTVSELFDLAARHHQSSNLVQAELLYRQILQADPSHAQAHHLLGILARQSGRHQDAIRLIRKAIALNPTAIACHFNLGMVYKDLGQGGEAAQCFREELHLNPNHGDSHINLGIVLVGQGQLAEAIECYRHALRINPNHADAHNNLGIAFVGQGRLAEATGCFREALRIDPANPHTHINLGNALLELGRPAEAIACYRRALHINPAHAKARSNLAMAYNNLGNSLQDQGQLADAVDCFQEALRLDPHNADVHCNLANARKNQGLLAEAAECIQQALALDSGHKAALWNRAHLRLLQGDCERGWPDYEHRWALPGHAPRTFQQPRWDGAPLAGKTILVYAEQGLGDTIQFARFLPLVKARGGTLLFECPPPVLRLLATPPLVPPSEGGARGGIDQLIPAGSPLPFFDVQIPLLSLPLLFGTTLATIPTAVPYLAVEPNLVEHWRHILESGGNISPMGPIGPIGLMPLPPLRIGIVWQGSLSQTNDRRSLPLSHFEALAGLEHIHLVSLQVGPGAGQLATVTFPVTDLGSRFNRRSLEDLAAAMRNMDLIVTVDTAVPHLAGALGVPVWVLLSFASDWRWLLDRPDSPWYPTMRLFRQSKPGDWGEVFERITVEVQKRNELIGWVKRTRADPP